MGLCSISEKALAGQQLAVLHEGSFLCISTLSVTVMALMIIIKIIISTKTKRFICKSMICSTIVCSGDSILKILRGDFMLTNKYYSMLTSFKKRRQEKNYLLTLIGSWSIIMRPRR